MTKELEKRIEHYIMNPRAYEISCDLCGGFNIEWSEYEHMIWCYDCQKDTPGNGGIFDGPIPYQAMKLLGISFDKIEIATGDRLYEHRGEKSLYWDKTRKEEE